MFRHSVRHPVIGSALLLFIGIVLAAPPLAAESLTLSVFAPDHRITHTGVYDQIVLDGYGSLLEPGKPILPEKRLYVALPPGARVISVQVTGIGATVLPGSFRIEPAPALQPTASSERAGVDELRRRMQAEWQTNYEAVYSSDRPYPESQGRLVASGALRKYAYAAVSFYPFSYSPRSGELIRYTGALIAVDYSLPKPGSSTALQQEIIMWDTAADERAERIFYNFDAVRDLYFPTGPRPSAERQTADYVIITTSALAPAINASSFVTWKESLGFDVETVSVSDPLITTQPGLDLAAKVRNFLRAQYGPWGIEYVLIVGDLSAVPMRYCYADPDNHTYNAGVPNATSGEVPTDFYYADLSDTDANSWDLDGDGYPGEWSHDSPDFLPEVFVGRIPTSEAARVTYTLDKLVLFEQDTGTWKHQALQAGAFAWFENEDFSGKAKKDLATYLSLIEADLMGGWTVDHYSEQAGLVPSIYPWSPLNATSFTDAWRAGQYGIVNWGGHGWSDVVAGKYWGWDDGDGVPENSNPQEIYIYYMIGATYPMEDDFPSIVFSLSCLVGYPEPNAYGNLGVDLLTKPSFGAAAGIVSGTRVVWVSQGGGELHCYEFNRCLIDGPNGPEKVGEAMYNSEFYINQTYSWNHFAEYWDMYTFNLYGDPAMVWEGTTPATGAGAQDPKAAALRLRRIYPNPFNPVTTISFDLKDAGFVNLSIYSVDGRLVTTIINEPYRAGRHDVNWDGVNNSGDRVASGTYFCRLQVGSYSETRRMTLIK